MIDLNKLRFKKAVELAEVQKGERVLDLGSRNAILLNFLPNCNYIGLDIEPTNENVIKTDLENGLPLEIKEKKFDVIFILEVIEHIENFKSLLIECREILSENGRIIITTPTNHRFLIKDDKDHIHCFRRTNLYNLVNACKLRIEKLKGIYVIIPRIISFAFPFTFYNESWLIKIIK